jgi:hypothetical protein
MTPTKTYKQQAKALILSYLSPLLPTPTTSLWDFSNLLFVPSSQAKSSTHLISFLHHVHSLVGDLPGIEFQESFARCPYDCELAYQSRHLNGSCEAIRVSGGVWRWRPSCPPQRGKDALRKQDLLFSHPPIPIWPGIFPRDGVSSDRPRADIRRSSER